MKVKDYVPKVSAPTNRMYNCPIKEDTGVSRYRVLVDQDIENNQVYINLGYDDKTEYDSSFFLSIQDARDLGKLLISAADHAYQGYSILNAGKKEVEALTIDLNAHNVHTLRIKPTALYVDDPEDSFFGSMIIFVEYSIKDNPNKLIKFMVISDNYGPLDVDKYANVIDTLRDKYKVTYPEFDSINYKNLILKISKTYSRFISSKNKATNDSAKMKPNDNQDIAALAKEIVSKMKKDVGE